VFGLQIPDQVPDVPTEVLDPRATWSDPGAYDRQAKKLREMFEENIHMIGKSASTAG
jgi:phosphoenolpyruvate carboxykinase (ATP)